jgi:hypothetical protein
MTKPREFQSFYKTYWILRRLIVVTVLLVYFPYSEEGESKVMRSQLCASKSPLLNFRMPEPIFMKTGVYTVTSDPIKRWLSYQSVWLYVCNPYTY